MRKCVESLTHLVDPFLSLLKQDVERAPSSLPSS